MANPADKARKALLNREKRQGLYFLAEFRKIADRLKADIDITLKDIEQSRKDNDGVISPGLISRNLRLNSLLNQITAEINSMAAKFADKVADGQAAAVDIAKNQMRDTPEIAADLQLFDSEATKELIGIGGDGGALAKHFERLGPAVTRSVVDELTYGIGAGLSNQAIAKAITNAIGAGIVRAMTIARTETNRAYREASRKFYDETPDVIGWRWMSALDLRTCPVCWRMHGTVSKTSVKFGSHPNCRCVMVPVFADSEDVETGSAAFAKLTPAQQKTILGPRRLEMYNDGARLRDFVETYKSNFGTGRRVKTIANTTFKRTGPAPAPKPIAKPTPAATTPKPTLSAPEFNAAAIRTDFVKNARPANFVDNREPLRLEYRKAADEYWAGWGSKREDDAGRRALEARTVAKAAYDAEVDRIAAFIKKDRAALRPADPIRLTKEKVKGFPKKKRPEDTNPAFYAQQMDDGIAGFEGLVDRKAWPDPKPLTFTNVRGRASYWGREVKVDFGSNDAVKTTVHEISHGLEMENPANLKAANDFLNFRTPGEKPVKLNKLYKGYGYRADEIARPDKFTNAYIGKQYGTLGNQYATEVISMGFERLYEDPLAFALEDPGYFDFIITIARGEKWLMPK